jgi:hypothetical protein
MWTDWYVIDTRTNEIVNCISSQGGNEPSLAGFTEPEHLRLDRNPPRKMLERYLYWSERP